MRRVCLGVSLCIAACAIFVSAALAQDGPYKVLKAAKVGGEGGFDYVYADSAGRKLYVPRSGNPGRVSAYDLDALTLISEIPDVSGHGAAVDPKSHHGFVSSNPVAMFDSESLKLIKTIQVQGGPDGILFDPFNQRVWVFSHRAPNATVINTEDGSIAGTVDLGGAPEQAVTDGKGKLYVDLEDKSQIAEVDAAAMKVLRTFDLGGKGGGPGGLAFDAKNHILFASCHEPATMVILNSETGKVLDALPIGTGTDGATFNPATMEAFSSNGDGTLTIIKENSPTSFAVEQNLKTMTRAKTLTLDAKTNHILLIAAETAPPPAAPAGEAPAGQGGGGRGGFGGRGRGAMVPGSFTILEVGK
ncbi:MAG TPA: YncE family protein [Bryobacteraceae bacterium]|nr:YncE family protein [Bryobacteraceae bacterium]